MRAPKSPLTEPPAEAPRVSVIMPVRNERQGVDAAVAQVLSLLAPEDELIVVDGESTDDTWARLKLLAQAHPAALRVLSGRAGRAPQMNLGARKAKGNVLLFLHADTLIPPSAWHAWRQRMVTLQQDQTKVWGRFDVRIVGQSVWLPVVSWMMNQRSRISRICTGDQALFVSASLFARVGQFPDQPLMEDIELCKILKTQPDAQFVRMPQRIDTSGRRWDQAGAWRTIVLMWRFRFAYWRGASPWDLARQYREIRARPPAGYPMEHIAHEQDIPR